jgi:hypothetical protein
MRAQCSAWLMDVSRLDAIYDCFVKNADLDVRLAWRAVEAVGPLP